MTITTRSQAIDADAVIAEMVDRLIGEFSPDRIALFGSRARGDAREYSDIDLLVVMPNGTDEIPTAVAMRLLLRDLPLDKDIVVTTPAEIEQYGHSWTGVLRYALDEGELLHELQPPSPELAAALATSRQRMFSMAANTPEAVAEAVHKLELAYDNLYNAPSILTGDRPMPAMVCFIYQQVAEHALKAAMVLEGQRVPHVHELHTLRERLPPSWHKGPDTADLVWLTEWSIKGRYPMRGSKEVFDAAERAGALAEEIYSEVAAEFTRRGIDVDFANADPTTNPQPPLTGVL